MDKANIIDGIEKLQLRLKNEVVNAYEQKGMAYGDKRFDAFRRVFIKTISDIIPSETSNANASLTQYGFTYNQYYSDGKNFWRNKGDKINAYLESLILDIKNDEIDLTIKKPATETPPPMKEKTNATPRKNKVFIVHGHDGEVKSRTARFIEKLGFEAVILHEQASRGKTIIEKIELYTDVDFAIVLYTPDDKGNDIESAKNNEYNLRARQNVIFEHGYLIAKIGRENVVPLVTDNIELPNDISGVVYISDATWEADIAKEMKQSGYNIDFNKLY